MLQNWFFLVLLIQNLLVVYERSPLECKTVESQMRASQHHRFGQVRSQFAGPRGLVSILQVSIETTKTYNIVYCQTGNVLFVPPTSTISSKLLGIYYFVELRVTRLENVFFFFRRDCPILVPAVRRSFTVDTGRLEKQGVHHWCRHTRTR